MNGKKTRHDFEPLGEILQATLQKWMNTAGAPIFKIWKLWDAAVGEEIARHAHPASVDNHILTVHVPSSVWIQQLRFSRKSMVDKINTAAGSHLVSDILFKINAE